MTRDLYADTLAAGAIAGSYEILAFAFEGGFSQIYRAAHLHTKQPAAVKLLERAFADEPRTVERFYQEAAAVSRIEHANVVDIFEYGELPDGRPYIVMEWLEGRNLRDELCERGPLSAQEALAVMTDLGAALVAAHAIGVIHRDVKAENIIATPRSDGWFDITLLDFGIAKFIGPRDQHTAFTTQTIVGTPATMAPEQILREPIDERTDVYAMGVLLYHLVTGQLPFQGNSLIDFEQMHLHARPPRPSAQAPVTEALDRVVSRAMAKHPQHRYASPGDLIADLRRAVESPEASRDAAPRVAAGIGLYVHARASGDSAEHADRLCEVMDVACQAAADHGLTTALMTSDALLAIDVLPAAPTAVQQRTSAVVEAARSFEDQLAAHGDSALVRVSVAVRIGEVAVHSGGEHRYVGGELLDLAVWHDVLDSASEREAQPPSLYLSRSL